MLPLSFYLKQCRSLRSDWSRRLSRSAFAAEFGTVNMPVRWPMGTRQLGLLERQATVDDYLEDMRRKDKQGASARPRASPVRPSVRATSCPPARSTARPPVRLF
eukprot:SAG22_NODE_723_length_7636_cov_75.271726_11_plen_104_part_00